MNHNLTENIEKLIKGTNSGKIIWIKPNDNVFVWQTFNSNRTRLNVILQAYKISNNQTIAVLLRLFEVETKITLLDIKSEEVNPILKEALFSLYKTIKDKFEIGRIDILSDLLKDI